METRVLIQIVGARISALHNRMTHFNWGTVVNSCCKNAVDGVPPYNTISYYSFRCTIAVHPTTVSCNLIGTESAIDYLCLGTFVVNAATKKRLITTEHTINECWCSVCSLIEYGATILGS